MRPFPLARAIGALAALALIGAVVVFSMLPPPPSAANPPPIPSAETARTLAALRPPKRARPVIAVIGLNDATETTDYLMPMSVLRRADVGEVWALAVTPGPVRLYPALAVLPDATIAEFDERFPDGADYVIVPAMSRDDNAAVLAWIRRQAERGAVVIGVCAGARVLANTDLLDGRDATTHWYFLRGLRKTHPDVRYVKDRRFVVDGRFVTTTGITASLPMSLTLVEAIAGRPRAEAVARTLGLAGWDARHDSSAFRFNRRFASTVIGNRLRFWTHETLGVGLQPDLDTVALALAADAWSRTYRSRAQSYGASREPVVTRDGVRVIPDQVGAPRARRQVSLAGGTAAAVLNRTLADIGGRYGAGTAEVVAMQLEYPTPASGGRDGASDS